MLTVGILLDWRAGYEHGMVHESEIIGNCIENGMPLMWEQRKIQNFLMNFSYHCS